MTGLLKIIVIPREFCQMQFSHEHSLCIQQEFWCCQSQCFFHPSHSSSHLYLKKRGKMISLTKSTSFTSYKSWRFDLEITIFEIQMTITNWSKLDTLDKVTVPITFLSRNDVVHPSTIKLLRDLTPRQTNLVRPTNDWLEINERRNLIQNHF